MTCKHKLYSEADEGERVEVVGAVNDCHKVQSLNMSPPLSRELLVLSLPHRGHRCVSVVLPVQAASFAGI